MQGMPLSPTSDVSHLAGNVLDRACRSAASTWFSVFSFAALIYLLTAHWWTGQVNDAVAASWPAWQLAHAGTFDLASLKEDLPNIPWFAEVDGRIVANRMMGVILVAVPANVLLAGTGIGPEAVGALTAAVLTAAAVANMAVALRKLTSPRRAVTGALLLGFGTSVWTVASAELWTHGPNAFWLTTGLVFLTRDRFVLAGLAMGPAIMTRPHMAVAIAVIGLGVSWAMRSVRPAVSMGIPAGLSVAGLVTWNNWYYGQPSLGGAYRSSLDLATRAPTEGSSDFLVNVAGATVSGWCGLFLYSPVALALLLVLRVGWSSAPSWVRAAFLGGLAYQVIQFRLNIFTGGGAFFGNRLIIELLVLSTPLVAVGYARWSEGRPGRVAVTTTLAGMSVGIHAIGALLADWRVGGTFSDWTVWYPALVVRSAGLVGAMVLTAVLLVVALVTHSAIRRARNEAQGLRLGFSSSRRPSRPLTNLGDSSVDSSLARAIASSMTTASGTSSRQSSS
jgi:hypothetical protein